MTVERYGSKTDVIVKLVLVFFIALLSFSIGTFVGKKFSDNQHKLAQLEPGNDSVADVADHHGDDRSVASVNPEAGEVKPNEALTDEEIAKLAEEFISDDEGSAKVQVEGTHAATEGHSGATHEPAAPVKAEPIKVETKSSASVTHEKKAEAAMEKKAEPLKAAERVAEGKAPAEKKAAVAPTSRIPSSLPKEVAASAIGKYTVQVGSYQSEKEAQKIAADLKEKGFSAFYVSAKVKGNKWYRVSVGLFATQKEANAYRADLLTRSKVSSAIVQKITSAE